ncbi:hypothetical protein QTP70_021275 [Hemibagrus guttatus]|uniref:Reelin n=1 Tax=Hemibagrus guttatus TaxID=175788 RepID=A0AAE0V8N5_9TELE|nr:hypothetical protein QTP70_021275 [Hemibagrus guttatus]
MPLYGLGGQGFLSLFPMLPSQRVLSFAGYRLDLELAICGPLTMVMVTILLNINKLQKLYIGPACLHFCSGRGQCSRSGCKCDPGFSGQSCELATQTFPAFLSEGFSSPRLSCYHSFSSLHGAEVSFGCGVLASGKALVFNKDSRRHLVTAPLDGSQASSRSAHVPVGGVAPSSVFPWGALPHFFASGGEFRPGFWILVFFLLSGPRSALALVRDVIPPAGFPWKTSPHFSLLEEGTSSIWLPPSSPLGSSRHQRDKDRRSVRSFGGGRRSVRVLGGGRRSALLFGGGCRSALLLSSGRRSALLLDCGHRSAPPLGCGRTGTVPCQTNREGAGRYLQFTLRLGSRSTLSSCPAPDQPGEGLLLHYSSDNGITWSLLQHYSYEGFHEPRIVSVELPPGAQKFGVQFRWWQPHHSGSGQDVWALDEISMTSVLFNTISLDFSNVLDVTQSLGFYLGRVQPYCQQDWTLCFSGETTLGSSIRYVETQSMQIGASYTLQFSLIMGCGREPSPHIDTQVRLEFSTNHGLTWHLVREVCLPGMPSCPEFTAPSVYHPSEFINWKRIAIPLHQKTCKERAADLPAHRPWDCAIDLIPNAMPPKSHMYPLSIPERRAMDEYIEEALSTGYIRPSTSPVAAGFFFVEKKDDGLRPCIDYRGLNALTVRYPYPLPLVPAALEQLRGAMIFTNLDLRSAYNLIHIKEVYEWKTAFHTTSGHSEYMVMPYGLTNAPAVFQSLINKVYKDVPNKKLWPKFIGPFEIVWQPVHEPHLDSVAASVPSPPLDIDGSPEYQLCSLLDSRCLRGWLQYLVDWEGYGPEERSWADAAKILDPSLTEEFHRAHLVDPHHARGGARVGEHLEMFVEGGRWKGRELADMMERRKVDILCVQETRWKGSKARSIGAGFKLFYYGVDSKRNGVGVVLKEEFVRNVLEVGCELEEKESFWSELDEVMESIPTGERVVIGADFNGHVGEGNTGDEEVMGKFGVKERNLEGQMIEKKTKWWKLKKEECCEEFRQKLRQALGGQVVLPDDWETTAEVIRETGRKVLGVSSGRRKEDKETWWWNEEVQDSVQRKRLAKKKWDMDRTEENRQEYKELQRRVKREVSKAKQKAYEELYTRLDTREGEKDLYRLARQRDRDGKDVQQVRVIKDRDGRVLTNLEKAYDRVPREELWYCMRKSGVAEKYVRVVQDMYERSRTVVRCAVGQSEEFNVEVGLHQGSALSPFLFAMVMDQLSEEVRQESPWTMMFADDIVICSESREQVEENLERWRFALERRGMKVSRSKTEYMCVNEREGSGTVRLQGEEVKKVQEFKYLGSTVQSNGECGKEVKNYKPIILTFFS